jgi:hypothetical protein
MSTIHIRQALQSRMYARLRARGIDHEYARYAAWRWGWMYVARTKRATRDWLFVALSNL